MVRTTFLLIPLIFTAFSYQAALAQSNDMMKPSEIQTTGESSNPTNDSGGFIGGGFAFGQARTTEDGVNPGVAMLLSVEPGYQVNRGSWNRLEFSGQFFTGKAEFGSSDVNIGLGVLAKIGYGYSLGDRLIALFKFGAGPVLASFETKAGTEKVKSDGTLMGLGLQGAWQMVFPMSDAMDLTGGLSWTHIQFSVDDVKDSSGTKYALDRQVIANVPALDIGLRVRF